MRKNQFQKAEEFAKNAHKGQKYNGQAYFSHPKQVGTLLAWLCPDKPELYTAGLLHDVLEETTVTYKELEQEFGRKVAQLVKEVTKTDYNRFPSLESPDGVILKFADRLCNLVNMQSKSVKWQERYLKKSIFWQV